MDAIEYLTDQHREIESLFDQIESAARTRTRLRLRRKLVDLLAVHAAVEETIFYPAAQDAGVGDGALGALEEHHALERLLAEIVELGPYEAGPRMAMLRWRKRRHAGREERELFARARELLAPERLALLGVRMADAADAMLEPGVGARERITARRVTA
jgi:hypothetical protein